MDTYICGKFYYNPMKNVASSLLTNHQVIGRSEIFLDFWHAIYLHTFSLVGTYIFIICREYSVLSLIVVCITLSEIVKCFGDIISLPDNTIKIQSLNASLDHGMTSRYDILLTVMIR